MTNTNNLYQSNLTNLTNMKALGNSSRHFSRPRFIFQNSENPRNRKVLRRAFGNEGIRHDPINLGGKSYTGFFPQSMGNYAGLTPFRISLNAGDVFNSNNKAPWDALLHSGSNQINLPRHFGVGDGTSTVKSDNPRFVASAYSGNPRFVYDGSDFTRYKKLVAINRNYADVTFGGDQHSASQHAYRRVKNY